MGEKGALVAITRCDHPEKSGTHCTSSRLPQHPPPFGPKKTFGVSRTGSFLTGGLEINHLEIVWDAFRTRVLGGERALGIQAESFYGGITFRNRVGISHPCFGDITKGNRTGFTLHHVLM